MGERGEDVFIHQFHRLLADTQLRQAYLPPLTEDEMHSIQRLLEPVAAETLRWCQRYPILDARLLLPASIGAITQLPHLSAKSIATRVKATIWIPAFDDLLDRNLLPLGEIEAILHECLGVACLSVKPSASASTYAAALLDIVNELSQQPLWHDLHAHWAVSLSQVLEASMYEYWLQRRLRTGEPVGPLPLIDEYLFYARKSMAISYLWITSLILEHDQTFIPALTQLVSLAEQCSQVMRLANDLATHARETSEGGVNSIVILAHTFRDRMPELGMSDALERARDEVTLILERERIKAQALAANLKTDSLVERRFLHAMDFGVELYKLHDFRAWPSLLERKSQE